MSEHRAAPPSRAAEPTELMLGDLEYWRKFLLRARSRAGETPEASVHIDHLTAAALCIGNVLKFLKSAAPSEPPAPAASSGAEPQERNMYGCTPCPKCASRHRYQVNGKPEIVCDDCGHKEAGEAVWSPPERPTPAAPQE